MNAADELLEAFRLVEEYNLARPKLTKEPRLYYRDDGTIIGLWDMDYPDGDNYIVLEKTDAFHNNNTHNLRVKNKKLILLDCRAPNKVKLAKSQIGIMVVKGHAALVVNENEFYKEIEYYDKTNS